MFGGGVAGHSDQRRQGFRVVIGFRGHLELVETHDGGPIQNLPAEVASNAGPWRGFRTGRRNRRLRLSCLSAVTSRFELDILHKYG